jgi:hypothetical protein
MQNEVVEDTFATADREERQALLRMLGAMDRYTPTQLLLIATLPIVEVWDAKVQRRPMTAPVTGKKWQKGHNCDVCPPLGSVGLDDARSFVSVQHVVKRGEMFYSDGKCPSASLIHSSRFGAIGLQRCCCTIAIVDGAYHFLLHW